MSNDVMGQNIEALANLMGLDVEPEWRENVAAFFEVARGMAERVEKSGAGALAEQAPVFTPRTVE